MKKRGDKGKHKKEIKTDYQLPENTESQETEE